jgi:chorismate dehydratase
MSDSRPETVNRVFLDYRSGTSVKLIKVIARNFWLREPEWINTSEGFDFNSVGISDAVVLIGDQCFELENRYSYSIDLAEEWKNFTGLPFVFACWIANRELPSDFISDFSNALALGVNNLDKVAERFENTGAITGQALKDYLKNNIDYNFDERKREALDLFLGYLSKL